MWIQRRGTPIAVRTVTVLLGALAWIVIGAPMAHANRFGPPWQSRVIVDQTMLYTDPDRSSDAVGPLSKGQIVVVVAAIFAMSYFAIAALGPRQC